MLAVGLHTCTAVARSLCVSWAFLFVLRLAVVRAGQIDVPRKGEQDSSCDLLGRPHNNFRRHKLKLRSELDGAHHAGILVRLLLDLYAYHYHADVLGTILL